MHYFTNRVNLEVKEVYWTAVLHSFALSLVFIFEPIYLYTLGYSVASILWFYVEVYACYCVLVFFGAKFASKFGFKHSVFVSNIFYLIYWVVLFSIKAHPVLFAVAPIFFALQKSCFWPAYDSDVALNSQGRQRGREVGVLLSLIQISAIIGPFFGGFISEQYGFNILFGLASLLMLISVYPLFRSREIYSKHQFRFSNFVKIFRNNRANFFGYWGYAEDLMLMSLWPIYMFIVVPNFFSVGFISTIAAIIGTMLMLYIGTRTDAASKRELLLQGSVFYGATWILRFAATSLGSVLAFDALTKIGKSLVDVPLGALTLSRAAEKDADHAIAYNVFYEFSLSIGKILTALAGILIFSILGNTAEAMYLIFALVGILTMLYGFLK